MAAEISKRSKSEATLPKGAKILSKNTTINVEEIENGFIVSKSYDIKYQYPEKDEEKEMRTDYLYYTKKWFTKEDPMILDPKDKSLADAFKD